MCGAAVQQRLQATLSGNWLPRLSSRPGYCTGPERAHPVVPSCTAHPVLWLQGGPTMAMIANKCPDIDVVVLDINEVRIAGVPCSLLRR